MNIYKILRVGSTSAVCLAVLAACQGNGFQPRHYTTAEIAAFKVEQQKKACNGNPVCLTPAKQDVPFGSQNVNQSNPAPSPQVNPAPAPTQPAPTPQPAQPAPTQAKTAPAAPTKPVAPALTPQQLDEANSKFLKENIKPRDALISQDNLALQNRDADLNQIFEGMTVTAASPSGKSSDLMLTIDALLKFGDQERILSVAPAPLRYSQNGEILPLQINLRRNTEALGDQGPVSTFPILARAVCQDQNCQQFQVRFDFGMSDRTRVAVFQYQLRADGYDLVAFNLTGQVEQLKSFTEAQNAMAKPVAEKDQKPVTPPVTKAAQTKPSQTKPAVTQASPESWDEAGFANVAKDIKAPAAAKAAAQPAAQTNATQTNATTQSADQKKVDAKKANSADDSVDGIPVPTDI